MATSSEAAIRYSNGPCASYLAITVNGQGSRIGASKSRNEGKQRQDTVPAPRPV